MGIFTKMILHSFGVEVYNIILLVLYGVVCVCVPLYDSDGGALNTVQCPEQPH